MDSDTAPAAYPWVASVTHGGNLRLFSGPPPWQDAYAASLPGMAIFGDSALGMQFCRDGAGMAFILDPETRHLNEVGLTSGALMECIDDDPAYGIDQAFFEACCAAYGVPAPGETFGFVHPLALGGKMEVANVSLRPCEAHMAFLAMLSAQIENDPPGTQYHPVPAQRPDWHAEGKP